MSRSFSTERKDWKCTRKLLAPGNARDRDRWIEFGANKTCEDRGLDASRTHVIKETKTMQAPLG